MLTFELESCENGKYIYIFYPDGNKNAPGKVAIYEDGKREIIQQSSADFRQFFMGHALRNIDIKKKSGTIAWY